MSFETLSDEQKSAFERRLLQLGIDPATVVESVGPEHHSGPMAASVDESESAIRPHIVIIDNVDSLKELHGIPDDHYDIGTIEEHHPIPDPWPTDRAVQGRDDLSMSEYRDVHTAHIAYLYGDSKRVASYRDAINAVEYPRRIPVFAAKTLSITAANSPYVIKPQESGHVYGVVTIYEGGQIKFEGDTDFNVQKMVKSDAAGPS